jgi:TP901 family phage tail tape measure protein
MAGKTNLGSLYAYLGIDSSDWDKTLAKTSQNLKKFGNDMEKAGLRLSVLFGGPLALLGKNALNTFAEFDSAFAGIKKTVNSFDNFASLEKGIRNLSKEMPQTASQLSRIGEIAGQLGVREKDLLPFIKTMAMIGDTTNLSSEEASLALAKFTNVLQFPRAEIEKLGDSLIAIGNNSATMENDIVQMSLNWASAGRQAGLTAQEIFGISASLSGLGEDAEAGGTSLQKIFGEMVTATKSGGDALKVFQKIAGPDFKQVFEKDASDGFNAFAKGLEKIRVSGQDMSVIFNDLGLQEVRVSRALSKMSSNSLLFADAIKLVNESFGKASGQGALSQEALKRYATYASQMQILGNRMDDVGITIGRNLAPKMLFLNQVLAGLIGVFDNIPKPLQDFVINLGVALATISGGILVVGSLAIAIGSLASALGLSLIPLAGWAGAFAGALTIFDNWKTVSATVVAVLDTLGLEIIIAGKLVANEMIGLAEMFMNKMGEMAVDAGNKMREWANDFAGLFGKSNAFTPKVFTPIKLGLYETGEEVARLKVHGEKWHNSWNGVSKGIKAGLDKVTQATLLTGKAYEESGGKATKAEKAQEKMFKKLAEEAEKASESIVDKINEIENATAKLDISKGIEDALEKGDFKALDEWKAKLTDATREGIIDGFLKKGGSLPLSAEDSANIDKLTTLEVNDYFTKLQDKFDKKGGILKDLPNYLSRTITESIIDGFDAGFSSEALISGGKALSSIFAQQFQDSFQALFGKGEGAFIGSDGTFNFENLAGSFANLGIAYGINSLSQNLSDNKKDTQGGIIGGAVLGASLGSSFGPWGTLIGGLIGGAGGALAGSLGPSTNSNTDDRHDTATYIEELLKEKGGSLSFLKDGYNIQEGGDTRFNTTDSGGWMQSLGEAIVDGYAYYYGGAVYGTHDATGGQTAHSAGADALASPKPEVGSIQGPGWADQYWAQFGQEGGENFQALGASFSEMAGTMGEAMGQVGVIIAENLNGNLDNARVLLQTLDISAEDLAQSFLNIGLSGEESWHQVEIWMQSIPELTGEGLVAFADLDGAIQRFRESAGTGKQSLVDLKNIMAEAREAGVKDFGELRTAMINQGIAVEDVDRFIQAMGQRGITTMEQFANASDRDLGGVVADMESLGFQWENVGDGIEGADKNLDSLSEKLQKLENKEVDIKINVNYEENDKPKELEGNSNFDFAGSTAKSLSGGNSSRSLKSLNVDSSSLDTGMGAFNINIDARGAGDGVEAKIMGAIMASQKQIMQGTISAVQQMSRRGAL